MSWREDIGEYGASETYVYDVIDALQGLPDKRGRVEDIYRQYQDERGEYPLQGIASVVKGSD